MVQQLFDGGVLASHHMFFVYDAAIEEDDLTDVFERIPPSAFGRLTKIGYEKIDSFLMIRTHADSGGHWLQIFTADGPPSFEEEHEFEAILQINIESNRIFVRAPTDTRPQGHCQIPAGNYRLYLLGYHLGKIADPPESARLRQSKPPIDHAFEGYRLVFVLPIRKE